jgi:hypothetical protein
VKELSCWFTYILEALTANCGGAAAVDVLIVLVGVDAVTALVGVDAVTALSRVDALTALSSARLSSGSTWMGKRRREL